MKYAYPVGYRATPSGDITALSAVVGRRGAVSESNRGIGKRKFETEVKD
ncbi:MAG: hypothetical protein LBU70_02485 [Chitinispirillales bacterium]|nr:hypothetical protein [Chitinispirillales bacterium]